MIKHAKVMLGVIMGASLVAGCSTLPSQSDPQALRPFEGAQASQAQGPEPDRAPDLLIRDFYAALAQPNQQYQLARTYLTPDASAAWNPDLTINVVDRLDVNVAQPGDLSSPTGSEEMSPDINGDNTATIAAAAAESTADVAQSESQLAQATYRVSGLIVGQVEVGGGYVPNTQSLNETIELQKVDGQWRISSLPNSIVVEKTELRNRYSSHSVYFFEPGGGTLVSDRRWLYSGSSSLDTALISLIVEGPSDTLAPGVLNELPAEAAFAGITNGVYQLTGVAKLNDDAQRRLAAQLVWTLALADIPGPYHLAFDGANVVSKGTGSTDLTVDDFAEFNPQAATSSIGSLFAIRGGQLVQVTGNQATPVAGALGQMTSIESADIASSTATVALVSATGEDESKDSRLLLAGQDGATTEILKARTLSRPTFEYGATSVWTVLDGETVVRISRSAGSGDIAQTTVDTTALGEDPGPIESLRLSYTGVRAAFIIAGRVFVATVSRPNAGERKLTNVQQYAADADLEARTLDWQPDGSLVVGTSNPDRPVWRIEQDGSNSQTMPAANIQAPVDAVAATSSNVYVTDSRAALELSTTGTSSTFWREVQGLEGGRNIPIVSR